MFAVRRVVAGVGIFVVLGLATGVPAASAQAGPKPGTATGAKVVQTGWWWRANESPADGTGVIAAPEPPAPHMPEGALPAAAAAGDPEKISAIEFTLDYGPGATVQSFQLSLRESGEPGANVNADADTTKVVACPVTESFWIGGAASRWNSVPEYDCELVSAPGTRAANGVWTFDLTAMASTWLTAGSTQPTAVVLVEDVAAPETFQVAFDGRPKGVGLKLLASGGAPPPPPPPVTGPDSGSAGAVGDLGPGGASGSVPTDSGDVPAATGDAPTAAEPAGGTPEAAAAPDQQASGQGPRLVGLFEDLSGGALALIPIALLLAYLTMLALGPSGEPVLATARHGVGRALDRMRATRTKEHTDDAL